MKKKGYVKCFKNGDREIGGPLFQLDKNGLYFQLDKTKKAISCPDCGETMPMVHIKSGDTPLFSGYGPCGCEVPKKSPSPHITI